MGSVVPVASTARSTSTRLAVVVSTSIEACAPDCSDLGNSVSFSPFSPQALTPSSMLMAMIDFLMAHSLNSLTRPSVPGL